MHRSAKIHRLNQPSTYDTVYRMHNYSFIIHLLVSTRQQ